MECGPNSSWLTHTGLWYHNSPCRPAKVSHWVLHTGIGINTIHIHVYVHAPMCINPRTEFTYMYICVLPASVVSVSLEPSLDVYIHCFNSHTNYIAWFCGFHDDSILLCMVVSLFYCDVYIVCVHCTYSHHVFFTYRYKCMHVHTCTYIICTIVYTSVFSACIVHGILVLVMLCPISPSLHSTPSLPPSRSAAVTMTVEHNMTVAELSPLEPATTYQMTVAGVNRHGAGPPSPTETIMTIVPEGEIVLVWCMYISLCWLWCTYVYSVYICVVSFILNPHASTCTPTCKYIHYTHMYMYMYVSIITIHTLRCHRVVMSYSHLCTAGPVYLW